MTKRAPILAFPLFRPANNLGLRFNVTKWCTLVLCLASFVRVSHGTPTQGEIDALLTFFSAAPNLASIASSEITIDGGVDYGTSWTNNFVNLCTNGDGYGYYGLYCKTGHIAGLRLTPAWGLALSGSSDLSFILGLTFLTNLTVTVPSAADGVVNLVIQMTKQLPLEYVSISKSFLQLSTSDFGQPSLVKSLSASLGLSFSLTPFVNLEDLDAAIGFRMPSAYGIWPTSIQRLQITSDIEMTGLQEVVRNLTSLKSLTIASCFLDSVAVTAGQGTIASQSIEVLRFEISPLSYGAYTLTVNSSSLLDAFITPRRSLMLDTPNVRKFSLANHLGAPGGFSGMTHLEELSLTLVNINLFSFASFNFAPNLTSIILEACEVSSSDLSQLLCMVATDNLKVSSLEMRGTMDKSSGVTYELPLCLQALSQLKSLHISSSSGDTWDYLWATSSVMAVIPQSIEQLTLIEALDSNVNIDNFTQFSQLIELEIRDDRVVGEMRSDFLLNFPNLQQLTIRLNGTIPSVGWGNLRSAAFYGQFNTWVTMDSSPFLKSLSIDAPMLTTIPSDTVMVQLQSLEYLELSTSQTAVIPTPSFWTQLPRIQEVFIYRNNFSGPIASSIVAPRLVKLILSWSSICGSLPNFDVSTSLTEFAVDYNQFSGSIPASWVTNLTIRSRINLSNNQLIGSIPSNFLRKTGRELIVVNFGNNYFEGPVWNMSHNYPSQYLILSYTNLNVCETNPNLPTTPTISECIFLDVLACPSEIIGCNAYWSGCITINCTRQSGPRLPPESTCAVVPPPPGQASPSGPAPTNPSSSSIDQCPPPAPPGFECINGQWISNGSIAIPSITFPPNGGVIIVVGHLTSNGSLTFDGIGTSILVEGCVQNVPTEVIIIIKGDENLQTANLLQQKGSNCSTDLSLVPVKLTQTMNSCKRVKASTKDSTRSSLVVLFDFDSSKCKIKWIILGSVLGGIIFLSSIVVSILYYLSPTFQSCVRSCNPNGMAKQRITLGASNR